MTTTKPKLVVLNGSLNPPTLGHLTLLKRSMEAVGAARGLFLPASDAYVQRKLAKSGECVLFPATKRVAMVEAMCEGDASLGISLVDIDADDPTTYDSLRKIAAMEPDYELVLAIGADKIKTVPRWRKSRQLLRDFKLVISSRAGVSVSELIAKSGLAAEFGTSVIATFEIDGEVAEVSSSKVRRQFAEGQDYSSLLHPGAAKIVAEFRPEDFKQLDFAAWAKIVIASGRFGLGKVCKRVYEMNRDLFRDWANGAAVTIPGGLGDRAALLNGTQIYREAFDVASVSKSAEPTKTGCVNDDCADVARRLMDTGYRPAILNLASRRHACGGYDAGTSAQEESLCQSSTLSQSLYQYFDPKRKCVKEAMVKSKGNVYPMDIRFGGIYSPNVRFFRRGKRELFAMREQPFDCSVITVAALSFREPNNYCNEERLYMNSTGGFTPEGESIQLDKIRTIYRIALANGHDSVILGAFGCGVNKLPCADVARQFQSVLDEPEFAGKFRAVVFAIAEGLATARKKVEELGKFAPFYTTFGRW